MMKNLAITRVARPTASAKRFVFSAAADNWFSKRQGFAKLVACADDSPISRLTTVSHRAPARLLPLRGALAELAGAATCVLGSYGGGLLGGDIVDVNIHAKPGTTLVMGTQASTKVYRTNKAEAQQRLDARVDAGALLVWAPDPLVPFARSAYEGLQSYKLAPGGSVVSIDWLGSGRAICGERWAFDSYKSRTELIMEDGRPALVEALTLAPGCSDHRAAGFDIGGVTRDAVVSVVVGGPRASEVAARLHAASAMLAQRRTGGRGVRDARDGVPSVLHDEANAAAVAPAAGSDLLGGLLGDIVLGVSDVPVPGDADAPVLTVARLVAEHNEDGTRSARDRRNPASPTSSAVGPPVCRARRCLAHTHPSPPTTPCPLAVYRLLHHCMDPLKPALGVTPYSDRLHATVAAQPIELHEAYNSGGRYGEFRTDLWRRPPVVKASAAPTGGAAAGAEVGGGEVSAAQVLRLVHLCDATMPTGGFAHSGGLEAALQLGLLGQRGSKGMRAALLEVGSAAVLSAAQQQVPFALAAHALVSKAVAPNGEGGAGGADEEAQEALTRDLTELNAQQHALLVANAPSCRASLQLGGAIGRIAGTWVESVPREGQGGTEKHAAMAARALKLRGGVHGALAMGALAAVLDLPANVLHNAFIYTTARDQISAAVRLNLVGPLAAVALQDEIVSSTAARSSEMLSGLSCGNAAGSAPLLEAAHACHDLLERRVFQT